MYYNSRLLIFDIFLFAVSESNLTTSERNHQTKNRKRNAQETDQHTRSYGNNCRPIDEKRSLVSLYFDSKNFNF